MIFHRFARFSQPRHLKIALTRCAHKGTVPPVTTTYATRVNGNMDEQREDRIHVRVNAPEKRKFEKLAKSRHTDISELVRQLLHREADSKTSKAGG